MTLIMHPPFLLFFPMSHTHSGYKKTPYITVRSVITRYHPILSLGFVNGN